MQQRNDISSFDAILDAKYGAVGTAEREAFRKEATNYCVGQIILDARKPHAPLCSAVWQQLECEQRSRLCEREQRFFELEHELRWAAEILWLKYNRRSLTWHEDCHKQTPRD